MTAEEKSALTGQAAEYWLLFLSPQSWHGQADKSRGGNLLMVILFSDCKTTKAQNAPRVCGHLSFANCNSGIYIWTSPFYQ